jgi:hypothetical protein
MRRVVPRSALCALLCALSMLMVGSRAAAQETSAASSTWASAAGKPDAVPLFGRVLSVKQEDTTAGRVWRAGLALLMRAPEGSTVGKVPEDMAQQAASLNAAAAEYERAWRDSGRPVPRDVQDKARRMRDMAQELLRWRQIDWSISSNAPPTIDGVERVAITGIAVGDRLRIAARGDKPIAPGLLPQSVVLVRDALQVNPSVAPMVRRLPVAPGLRQTFFEFVGDVSSVGPLVIQVAGRSDTASTPQAGLRIQVETPPQFGFIQRQPLAVSELKPGQRFSARVRLSAPLTVESVDRILVYVNVDTTAVFDEERDAGAVRAPGSHRGGRDSGW